MKTNEAREIAAEDHSLSRFMGSKRAMGDDIEQLADLVYTDKRQEPCLPKTEIVKYLNIDPTEQRARHICNDLDCLCGNGQGESCDCKCPKQSGNTKLAK